MQRRAARARRAGARAAARARLGAQSQLRARLQKLRQAQRGPRDAAAVRTGAHDARAAHDAGRDGGARGALRQRPRRRLPRAARGDRARAGRALPLPRVPRDDAASERARKLPEKTPEQPFEAVLEKLQLRVRAACISSERSIDLRSTSSISVMRCDAMRCDAMRCGAGARAAPASDRPVRRLRQAALGPRAARLVPARARRHQTGPAGVGALAARRQVRLVIIVSVHRRSYCRAGCGQAASAHQNFEIIIEFAFEPP